MYAIQELPEFLNTSTIDHIDNIPDREPDPSPNSYTFSQLSQPKQDSKDRKPYLRFPFYIFQIGFNKAGTRTLTDFLRSNGVSVFHRFSELVPAIKQHFSEDKPLFKGFTNRKQFFADFDAWSLLDDNKTYPYEIIDKQYPNSKFIFNIRNINHWLKSRFFHWGYLCEGWLIDCNKELYGLSTDIQVLNQWKQRWYDYSCHVLKHFTNNNIDHGHLLLFDIETDPSEKLVRFFERFDMDLDGEYWGHKGDTKVANLSLNVIEMKEKVHTPRWNNLTKYYPELLKEDKDLGTTEFDRIHEYCHLPNPQKKSQQK